jgi:hypothetical protein
MSIRKIATYAFLFIVIGPPLGSLVFSIPATLFMPSERSNSVFANPSGPEIILIMLLASYLFGWLPAAASGITYGAFVGKSSNLKLYTATAVAGLLATTLICIIVTPQQSLNPAFLLIPTFFASVLTTGLINLFR